MNGTRARPSDVRRKCNGHGASAGGPGACFSWLKLVVVLAAGLISKASETAVFFTVTV
jgi:hypothetical protein